MEEKKTIDLYSSYVLIYNMEHRTSIQIGSGLLDKLKTLKVAKRESYHEIIERLIKIYEQQQIHR